MILAADRSKRGRCDDTEEVARKARRGFFAVIDPHLGGGGTSLHVSPRGEVKCVRGPRSNTVFRVFHESRVTKHESRPFVACFDRRVVRNAGQARAGTRHETRLLPGARRKPARIPRFSRITKHESRDTAFFRNTAFSVAPMVLVGTEALQSCFFGRNVLWVDSDDAVARNENPVRARRGRAGWRQQSRPSNGFSGIYETRDPSHGSSLARGASRREFRGFHESRDTRHETRLFSGPKHGFSVAPMVLVGTEALQSFFSGRGGLA